MVGGDITCSMPHGVMREECPGLIRPLDHTGTPDHTGHGWGAPGPPVAALDTRG
jgi:hypothetical protein